MSSPTSTREEGWLFFDARLPDEMHPPRAREESEDGERDVEVELASATLLDLNATLPAGCKIALLNNRKVRVRAEQPEPTDSDAPARQTRLGSSFEAALDQLRAGTTETHVDTEVPTVSAASPAPDLAGVCGEASWACEARADGAFVTDLGVTGAYVPATIIALPSGIAVEATLVEELPDEGACRDALASLLLRVNGAFRMVRAVFRTSETERRAVLEAFLPADATSDDLEQALGAVAIAAQHCAIEAQMVAEDDRLACVYLGRFGTAARETSPPEAEAKDKSRVSRAPRPRRSDESESPFTQTNKED